MTVRFIPIEKLDKKRHYEIIGIAKSGTSSLGNYLRSKQFDVEESELDFLNIDYALNFDYYNKTPIIITRNIIKRTWSDYNFFKRKNLYKAAYFSQYKAGFSMWDSLIYSLEYLKTLHDFPLINDNKIKPKLTKSIQAKIIKSLLQ